MIICRTFAILGFNTLLKNNSGTFVYSETIRGNGMGKTFGKKRKT
jgi:hypothetical protein